FAVVWSSDGQDGSLSGIYAQRFGSDGTRQGSEFRVNTYTTSNQSSPDIAMDPAGDFVVAWTSGEFSGAGQDGSSYGVYGQRLAADGSPRGGEFRINASTTDAQFSPDIGMDAEGSFVVAWTSGELSGAGQDIDGIFARRFDMGDGEGEFLVNTSPQGTQQQVSTAMNAIGDAVVVWESVPQDGSSFGIFGQRYDPEGLPEGSEFQINTYTAGPQSLPEVAVDGDGNFVVTWVSYGQDGSGSGIFGQRYRATGTPQGPEFQINAYTVGDQTLPDVAMDATGDFVVTWASYGQVGSGSSIYAQRYHADGNPDGGEFLVNVDTRGFHLNPSVASDDVGGFVVAWWSQGGGSGVSVLARQYRSDGVPQGDPFEVHDNNAFNQILPAVSMRRGGDFVISWERDNPGEPDLDVYARRFSSEGVPQGAEFQVNTYTTGVQGESSVSLDAEGGFVVVWESEDQDGSDYGVFARSYTPDGTPRGDEEQINTYIADRQRRPSVATDEDGNFMVAWESYGQDDSFKSIFARRFESVAVDAEEKDPTSPASSVLLKAYPNPTVSELELTYTLPRRVAAAHVTVFDVLGRKLIEQEEGARPAGSHNTKLALRGLPSGVYVVRLSADGVTATRRITVAR
ncbi:MAG: T9SS type A sorting domain-containing protein, partial [Bacteroidota bacterium]